MENVKALSCAAPLQHGLSAHPHNLQFVLSGGAVYWGLSCSFLSSWESGAQP